MHHMRHSRHKKVLGVAYGVLLLVGLIFAALVATDPGDNLVLAEARFAQEGGGRVVAGTVRNMTDRAYGQVRVEIELLDEHGNVAGSTFASAERIAGGEEWAFRAPVTANEAVRFRALVTSPENVRPKWLGGCSTTFC